MSSASEAITKSPNPTRLLLVDDHPLVRERLADVINREPDLMVCGEAEDRATALDVVEATRPDLLIVDLTLKKSDGMELIKDVNQRWPELRMLVVSMHDESLYAERVIRIGAHGYITKQEATRNILIAIRRIISGKLYLNEMIASRIIGRLTNSAAVNLDNPADCLADRELQVFELTGRGLNARQIARRLNLGVKTVETYRLRTREKLKLKDGHELLQRAIAWVHRH